MATAPVTILNFNPGSLTSPFTTASFTPVAGTRLVVFGVSARNAVITIEPTISSSALTWTRIGGVKTSTFSNPDLYIVGWISSLVPASPAAMTVTITNLSANAVAACVIQVAGADTDGTVIQAITGEDLLNGDPSYTFTATPGASRLVLGCCWMSGGNAITKPTTYVNLFDNTPTNITARRAEVHYAITSAPKGPNTSTSTNIRSIVLAVELGVTSGPAGAKNKVWSGSAWVEKPMARWSGSAWVQEAPKVWSGTAWVSSAMPPWTPPPVGPPVMTGLEVWHDASTLALADGATVTTWPNLGTGAAAWFVSGYTNPIFKTNQANSHGVVRFSAGGAGLRGRSSIDDDYTMIYVTRKWGTTAARSFSTFETNLLVGFHAVGFDCCHNSGWMTGFGTPWTGDPVTDNVWRMYGLDGTGTIQSNFYISGTLAATTGWTDGLGGTYGLSGWQETTADETMDCDVGELLLYNRKLTDPERVSVEGYLRTKWGLP